MWLGGMEEGAKPLPTFWQLQAGCSTQPQYETEFVGVFAFVDPETNSP